MKSEEQPRKTQEKPLSPGKGFYLVPFFRQCKGQYKKSGQRHPPGSDHNGRHLLLGKPDENGSSGYRQDAYK